MSTPAGRAAPSHTPVAVVWCRQVDNEAESPGYTTIPEEFPGRRETLESIRIVGNLTVNVADTHDYWDPDPSAPLSYYPNLFLYPAAGGRYTCVGRMFLSTEDRPRIGMKTLVFDTQGLLASGEFGPALLRAHATMGGRAEAPKPPAEPDTSVLQAVGEGFFFHRGSTEPVVVVTSEQWDSANQVAIELVRRLPAALVALGAFLVFPYFLPVAKVDQHQFSESMPLALAVFRVPKQEAQGDRHLKRIQGWEDTSVSLRDLTRPTTGRTKETVPLVLQYLRDHADEKLGEVARRVDLVEAPRLAALLEDSDRGAGRDRRKEMWRIGTAMETAALLLSRPRGRSLSVSGETARRANEYVKAKPTAPPVGAVAALAVPAVDLPPSATQHPPWLQRPADIDLPPPGPNAVPMSTQSDPSLLPPLPTPGPLASAPGTSLTSPSNGGSVGKPAGASPSAVGLSPPNAPPAATVVAPASPPGLDGTAVDARVATALKEYDTRWQGFVDARVHEAGLVNARALAQVQADLAARFGSFEASHPAPAPAAQLTAEIEGKVRAAVDGRLADLPERVQKATAAALDARLSDLPDRLQKATNASVDTRLSDLPERIQQAVKGSAEGWGAGMRSELSRTVAEFNARFTKTEEELRAALVAQLDLELREAKEQGSTLREEVEARVRSLIDQRLAEIDQKRAKDVRDLEQRLGLLVDGRSKDLESRLSNAANVGRTASEERFAQALTTATKRLEVDREARLNELSEMSSKSLAGLQVRMQSYLDQKLREDQERERAKYVELLARLKADMDDGLARTVDSARFDAAVRERVAQAVAEERNAGARTLAESEARLQLSHATTVSRLETLEVQLGERETQIAALETKARADLEDIDRRLQVLTDRMLPLVRQTWMRIDDLEKKVGRPEEGEVRYRELRRDLGRELRRVETELREEADDLRERLEATVTSQGRIWLNLVRQLSEAAEAGAGYVPTPSEYRSRAARRPTRRPDGLDPDDPRLDRPSARESPYVAFDEDPANPLDPRAPEEDLPPPRRAPGRAARSPGQP